MPGYNDTLENIQQTADIILALDFPPAQVQLRPFHEYGKVKYRSLDRDYPLEGCCWPVREQQRDRILYLQDSINRRGLPAVCGSSSKY